MYLFLLELQNIIIQDHDQGQEKENESQVWILKGGYNYQHLYKICRPVV